MFVTKDCSQRILFLALLLGAGLLVAGCCCTCPKYIGEKGPEPVNILVLLRAEAPHVLAFPDTARVCEEKQFARWVISGAPAGTRLEISFPEGSPFADRKSAEEQPTIVESGPAKPGTAGKRFKYVVTVRNEKGEKIATLDPYIEIWR